MIDWGGLVVVPTDTVYGLAAKPDPANCARIIELKGRSPDKNLQLLIPDASWLDRLVLPDRRAHLLADAFWPGPLTLVVAARDDAPPAVSPSGTIGLRVPAHPIALALLAITGPVAASSANRSGEPTPATIAEVEAVFGRAVDAYLDGGTIEGEGSSVVDLTGTEHRFLRPGSITDGDVERVLSGSI